MPKVGDKHFSYSGKGKKAAKAHAKKTGQKVEKYFLGGLLGAVGGGLSGLFGKKGGKGVTGIMGERAKRAMSGQDPMSTKNPQGKPAEQVQEAISKQNTVQQALKSSIPETNAQDRTITYEMGGEVGTGVYKKGKKK